MSSDTSRHDPCECGSGKKYKACCGAPKGEVTNMRVKDLNVFELTPGHWRMRSPHLWMPRIWTTSPPIVRDEHEGS